MGVGLPGPVARRMAQGWATASKKQYLSVLIRFEAHCASHGVDPRSPGLLGGLDFLEGLAEAELSYSYVNAARSLLSSFVILEGNLTFGTHPHVVRFMRGVRRAKPYVAKFKEVWDVGPVLRELATWGEAHTLSLEALTKKTVTLCLLASGQRVQTLQVTKRADVKFEADACTIRVSGRLKHSRDTFENPVLTFRPFEDKTLCVFDHLATYIAATDHFAHKGALFLGYSHTVSYTHLTLPTIQPV